jgi:hypothetical protein
MKFNVERLCELAGLDSRGRLLSENRSLAFEDDEVDAPVPAAKPAPTAKPAAAPAAPTGLMGSKPKAETSMLRGGKHLAGLEELDDEEIGSDYLDNTMLEDDEDDEDDETVYEIDEQELNEAIYKMRSQRIEEGKVRQQVRKELKQVVSEMGGGTSWMYGDRKPTNSKPGSVSRGFAGPGFKR